MITVPMLRSGYFLTKSSVRILLEPASEGIDPDAIGRELARQRDVVEVHDLHVREISSGFPALSAHVIVAGDVGCHMTRLGLAELLRDRLGVEHTTLQVDHEASKLLTLGE